MHYLYHHFTSGHTILENTPPQQLMEWGLGTHTVDHAPQGCGVVLWPLRSCAMESFGVSWLDGVYGV